MHFEVKLTKINIFEEMCHILVNILMTQIAPHFTVLFFKPPMYLFLAYLWFIFLRDEWPNVIFLFVYYGSKWKPSVQLLLHFNPWTWVGLFVVEDDNGPQFFYTVVTMFSKHGMFCRYRKNKMLIMRKTGSYF